MVKGKRKCAVIPFPDMRLQRRNEGNVRRKINVNDWWVFSKECNYIPKKLPEDWEIVCLPHTWNAQDGQDGGADYYRGACWYATELESPEREAADRVYLEFDGANSVASVFLNGDKMAYHEGGYSRFRVDITDHLKQEENLLSVCVDNSEKSNVYPQTADFTFYGGLYRDVSVVVVPETHFDMDFWGADGFTVSAKTDGTVTMRAYVKNPQRDDSVQFLILDQDGKTAAEGFASAQSETRMELLIPQPHLWQGIEDPYLYRAVVRIVRRNETVDEVSARFGVREFYVDPEKGFFLNGKSMPLRGVSRHQDRLGIGNALRREEHEEDARLIRELGANTIRLAHYQHSQYFYDICDELGFIVWAEIPFISVMNLDPAAHDNCRSQIKELVYQNYNHPCICFWGISNEITIGGERPGLLDHLRELNDLVKSMDSTRLTTMAHVSMVPKDSPMNQITDVLSYNHYFGWYGGKMEQNEVWLDDFHAMHPHRPLGLSEYGAEGIITYHNDDPKCRDYSEEYQALYHEHMAKIIDQRPYLWATHVWNMFDFGCDARDEGGVKGRNNKGLMTFDRKIKKDSFYVYKAYWSKEPFVHLCGRRYAQRAQAEVCIRVYSNQKSVSLEVNGVQMAEQNGDKVFVFEHIPLQEGFNTLVARSGEAVDSMTLRRVTEANPSYVLVDEEDGDYVMNWFEGIDLSSTEMTFQPGYYSIRDTVGEILENEEAGTMLISAIQSMANMKLGKGMMRMMEGKTVEELSGMLGSQEAGQGKGAMAYLNSQLQKIKK